MFHARFINAKPMIRNAGLALLRRAVAIGLVTGTVLALVVGPAMAGSCEKGCKLTTKRGCGLVGKTNYKGCLFECKSDYLSSAMTPEDQDTFSACMDSCDSEKDADRAACEAAQSACEATCVANPTCASSCGDTFIGQAKIVIAATKQCISSCADGDGACLQGCTKPGSSAQHEGQAALNDIYLNPSYGFVACMSTSSCTSPDSDGDGILEDGDNSGIEGDHPCSGGSTTNCDDNCSFPNPTQDDADGDGSGDDCDYNCTDSTGALVEGGVYLDAVAPASALSGAHVSVCKTGCCSHTTSDATGAYHFPNLAPGTYHLRTAAAGNVLPGSRGPLTVATGNTYSNEDIINLTPVPPPADTTIGSGAAGQVPRVRINSDETLTTSGCANGTASWSVAQPTNPLAPNPLATGAMAETITGSGIYSALIPQGTFLPEAAGEITIVIACPNPANNETTVFDVYIDPSGFTRFLNGNPAVGATVTLLRSDSPVGPFSIVPDGSAIMSPGNRRNPDLSDSNGHFGWDVIPGYYQVHAEIAGCSANSAVLEIPPAVTDLDLVFDCPCGAGPSTTCKTASKGQLSLADNATDDTKDSFMWKWSNGQSTSAAQFGTPLSTTAYDVCVYTAGANLLTALTIPADATGWVASGADGSKGFKYGDTDGLSTGVRKVTLKASDDNKTSIAVRAKGLDLPDAVLGNLSAPIIVQLQRRDTGDCFESTFAAAEVMTNSSEKLKIRK